MPTHTSKVQDIPLNQIVISPLHFERKHDEKLIDEMADDLNDIGLIHPLSVRKKGKTFELLAGERRYQALKNIRAKTARCVVHSCDDYTAELISIKENVHGTEPMTPGEERRAIDRVVELNLLRQSSRPDTVDTDRTKTRKPAKGNTTGEQKAREEAAEQLGYSEPKIRRNRNFSNLLTPSALRAYDDGRITQEQAQILSKLSIQEQREQLPKMLRETSRETSNRASLEKLGGKDENYKESIKRYNLVIQECEALSTRAEPLLKTMSVEAAEDIEEDTIAVIDRTVTILQRLRAHITSAASWGDESGDD